VAVTGYLWRGWLGGGGVQRLAEHPQKSMSVKADRVYLDCLSTGQGRQSRRQFLSRGHLGVVDQNRNDSDVIST
jgi:muramidase (phage lysozyme)